MNLEDLRLWLHVHHCRIYEEGVVLKRHYDNPADRLAETEEVRDALAKHRIALRTLARQQCPICRWPLKHVAEEGWRHDYCPKDLMHFSSGFSFDGKFSCGLESNSS